MLKPNKYDGRALRRQVALHMALNPDFYYEYVNPLCVSKTFELNKKGVNFSYESYVSSLYNGDMWGDQIVAGAIGRMWGVNINFIFPTGERPYKLFHKKDKPDIVVISNGSLSNIHQESSHFSGASM